MCPRAEFQNNDSCAGLLYGVLTQRNDNCTNQPMLVLTLELTRPRGITMTLPWGALCRAPALTERRSFAIVHAIVQSGGRRTLEHEHAVSKLVDLVAYQEGSVVSKTLMEKETGTVTLFAFDKGQGLSEHTAPFDAMVCVLDGVADMTIAGKPVTVRQGEAIIMPANEPHALEATERFKMMLVMIRS